jgi:pyrroloquinoline quinone biosynthesis protein B
MGHNTMAVILGIAQDGGVPHPNCYCETCNSFSAKNKQLSPSSIAVIDDTQLHLIDITRDLNRQLRMIPKQMEVSDIWLTHGHLGHIDGMGLFGKEAIDAKGIIVHASESMTELINNTPRWRSLIDFGTFIIHPFTSNKTIQTSEFLSITPIPVPHRNEWTDTHAFIIKGKEKSILYLPDHDTWEETLESLGKETIFEWFESLEVDIFFIDGTFWSSNELKRQNEVPHPPILETIQRLNNSNKRFDVRFIHLNHSNPLLNPESKETKILQDSGYKICVEGEIFLL